jgi:hypothetical protein
MDFYFLGAHTKLFGELEILTAFVAAAGHDVGHPCIKVKK